MQEPENPWKVPRGAQPPGQTQYRIRCPVCGSIARADFVGLHTSAVRCHWCRVRIENPKNFTVKGKSNED